VRAELFCLTAVFCANSLVCSFLQLDYYRQVSLARTCGWTREQILADLIYLEMPAELLVPVF
jgi:hypothetical protein